MKKIKTKHIVWAVVSVVLLAAVIAVNCVAVYWDTVLVGYFGTVGEGASGSADGVDTEYYKSNYSSDDELLVAQQALNLQIAEEGAVLMQNDDNALPLSSGSKVSVFSISSRSWITSGSGSGSVSDTTDTSAYTVKNSLEKAGFEVNETLWNFYGTMSSKYGRANGTSAGNGDQVGDWTIGEVPQSEYTSEVKASYSSYNDAAIVILSRSGGEGNDLPTDMSNHGGSSDEHYLQLNTEEKEMFEAIDKAGFKKVIVIINSANTLQMDFVDDYDIDAVLWLAGTGTNGIDALGSLLSGSANPSGSLVDTYVYDNMSSPAMQNFGWNVYTQNGSVIDYSFVNYSEGIYVDYKYYETRYEDYVLGTENVGTYDYSSTVYRAFGYGLSYTEFEYSDFEMSVSGDTITVKVTVTNVGEVAGKETVQFYYQSPYTEYDIEYGVEKSSVELIGFAKTSELGAGKSETVKTSFSISDMASYDSTFAKTYILDDGDYYITAASDAHTAVNNILKAKDLTAEQLARMEGSGNKNLVGIYENETFTKCSTSSTGTEITNQFDSAEADDAVYLTRSNWTMMENNGLAYATGTTTLKGSDSTKTAYYTAGTREVTSSTLSDLEATGWSNSGRPSSADDESEVSYGQDKVYDLADLIGADYDDERWDTLISTLKISEIHTLFNKAGYLTQPITSINKPRTYDYDGPSGISNYLNGKGDYSYCSEIVLSSTWNVDLSEQYGVLIGEGGLKTNTNGWYAPAMNIHRTPFAGRNFEYYSADAYLSGVMGAATIKGAQSMGMYCYVKHFALNDQESYRQAYGCVATWAQEQAIRETYLKAFQIAVEDGGAKAIMTSMNRIGPTLARGSYNLITNVLRNEWGFEGMVITDYVTSDAQESDQILAAGGDLILNTGGCPLSDTTSNKVRNALQNAAHNVLYVVANSSAMNGLAPGVTYSSGIPVYLFIVIAAYAVVVIAIGVSGFFVFRKKKIKVEEVQQTDNTD